MRAPAQAAAATVVKQVRRKNHAGNTAYPPEASARWVFNPNAEWRKKWDLLMLLLLLFAASVTPFDIARLPTEVRQFRPPPLESPLETN